MSLYIGYLKRKSKLTHVVQAEHTYEHNVMMLTQNKRLCVTIMFMFTFHLLI
jgi:hypothetical protein